MVHQAFLDKKDQVKVLAIVQTIKNKIGKLEHLQMRTSSTDNSGRMVYIKINNFDWSNRRIPIKIRGYKDYPSAGLKPFS